MESCYLLHTNNTAQNKGYVSILLFSPPNNQYRCLRGKDNFLQKTMKESILITTKNSNAQPNHKDVSLPYAKSYDYFEPERGKKYIYKTQITIFTEKTYTRHKYNGIPTKLHTIFPFKVPQF